MRQAKRSPKSASDKAQTRGAIGEDAAAQYLQKQEYRIIERNWRAGNYQRGEIDCIAWHHDQRGRKILCFIEVKTRSSNKMGTPQSAVNLTKQRQISALANAFISQHGWRDVACRFDVVEVWLQRERPSKIALHQNAFDYQE